MSNTIDNRAVEMEFNNASFERNISQSTESLKNLQNALKLDGVTKGLKDAQNGLDNVNKSSRSLDLSGIAAAASNVGAKFNTMSIVAITAISRLTNAAIDAGASIARGLSIDQVTAGWQRYADKTTSVQTIMAATAKNFSNQEQQMATVNDQLSKLNWYTDETSYNFVDMVNNIGKFTAAGQSLESSVTAMQGIANWAAISGQNAGTAARAMYNISQAMGTGAMKSIDWKSIEMANMATQEFKEKAIETALELGKLKQTEDGIIQFYDEASGKYKDVATSMEGMVNNFRGSLETGWFDTDVMNTVFNKYGEVADKLYDLSEASGLTATDIIALVDAEKAGTLSSEELASALGDDASMSVEELRASIEELSSEENEFGFKTFKAAQEAKTFQDAIDATKDAASTGWLNIFETIFGGYLDAKKVWTALANDLYDLFVEPLNSLQETLDNWKGLGGRNLLFGGEYEVTDENTGLKEIIKIEGAVDRFKSLIDAVKEPISKAWEKIFPPKTAEERGRALYDLTKQFSDFLAKIKPTEEEAAKLEEIFTNLFSTVKNVGKTFKNVWDGVVQIIKPIKDAFVNVLPAEKLSGDLNKISEAFEKLTSTFKITDEQSEKLRTTFETVFSKLYSAGEHVWQTFKNIWDGFTKFIKPLKDAFTSVFQIDSLAGDVDKVAGLIEKLSSKFTISEKNSALLKDAFEGLLNVFGIAKDIIMEVVDALGNNLSDATEESENGLLTLVSGILKNITKFREWLNESGFLKEAISGLVTTVSTLTKFVSKCVSKVSSFIAKIFGLKNSMNEAGVPVDEMTEKMSKMAAKTKKISDTFEKIKGVFTAIKEKFLEFANVIKERVGPVFSGEGINFTNLLKIGGIALLLSKVIGGIKKAFDGFSIIDKLKGIFDQVSDSIGDFGDAITKKVNVKSIKDLGIAIGIMAIALILLSSIDPEHLAAGLAALGSAVTILVLAFKKFASFSGSLKEMFKDAKQTKQLTSTLIKFAAAILIMAIALKILSGISWQGIAVGLTGLTGAMLILVGALFLINKVNAGKKAIPSLIGVALALLILTAAIKVLSKLSWKQLGVALVGLAGGVVILVGALALLALVGKLMNPLGLIAASIAMTLMAAAVLVLAVALKVLSSISIEEMSVALQGLFISLLVLVGAMMILSAAGPMILAAAAALLIASVALVALAAAIGVFAMIGNMPGMSEGIVMFAVAMGVLVAAILLISAVGPLALAAAAALLIASAGIVVFAIGLTMLIPAILMLKDVPWGELAGPLIIFSVAIAVLGAALLIAGAGFLLGGIGMIALGAGMLILGAALAVMNGLDLPKLALGLTLLSAALLLMSAAGVVMLVGGPGMIIFSAGLLIMAAALAIMNGLELPKIALGITALSAALLILGAAGVILLAGAPGLALFAAALLILATALAILNGVDIPNVNKGLLLLSTGLLALTAVSALLLSAAPGLLIGSLSLMAFSAALLVLAPALIIFSALPMDDICKNLLKFSETIIVVGLSLLGASLGLTTGGVGLLIFAVALITFIGAIKLAEGVDIGAFTALIPALIAQLTGLADAGVLMIAAAPGLIAAGAGLVVLGAGLGVLGPSLQTLQGTSLVDLGSGIKTLSESLLELGVSGAVLASVSGAFVVVVTSIGGFSSAMATAIGVIGISVASFNALNAIIISSGQAFIAAATAIKASSAAIVIAVSSALSSAAKAAGSYTNTMYKLGQDFMEGFRKGILSKAKSIADAASKSVKDAIKAAQKAQDSKSPSKETAKLGKWFSQGYAKGIEKDSDLVSDASRGLVKDSLKNLKKGLSSISSIINDEIATNPVISPVIDLSDVETKAGAISSLFNNPVLSAQLAGMANRNTSNSNVSRNIQNAGSISNGSTNGGINLYIDGIKYNTDDYIDSSITGFVEKMVRRGQMYGRS